MSELSLYSLLGTLSVVIGYSLFRVLLYYIPQLEAKEIQIQKEEIIKSAQRQKDLIVADLKRQEEASLLLLQEESEVEFLSDKEDMESFLQDLSGKEALCVSEETRLTKAEADLQARQDSFSEAQKELEDKQAQKNIQRNLYIQKLEVVSDVKSENIKQSMISKLVDWRQLEAQKVLKLLQEDITADARKKTQRVLDRILSRYQPNFIWPKVSNAIEVSDQKLKDWILEEKCELLPKLAELAGIQISPYSGKDQDQGPLYIRLSGGSGLCRESVKQTLSELLHKGPVYWKEGEPFYLKTLKKIEFEALDFGQEATRMLKLQNIHTELHKLIGALNWRTSYRQNQWYHTLEVAMLAGLLASELGVDPDHAKRVGLLHDIGKAIDYRIEGSHAVISGDYADRFGESRLICDTVMSHHSDLIVETPLAYILRAADTLSGARPGARVNLEEGYQIRLGAIYEVVQSFSGVMDCAIMNGGREVHVQVNPRRVPEAQVKSFAQSIARKIEADVAYPGQIKVVVVRLFESVCVA